MTEPTSRLDRRRAGIRIPGGFQALRWWDGRQWGPQTQPLPQQPPHPGIAAPGTAGYGGFAGQQGGTGQYPQSGAAYAPDGIGGQASTALAAVHPRSAPGPWAWAVASSPLLLLGVAALAALLAGVNVGVSLCILIGALIADVFAIFAAHRDVQTLRAAGEPVSSGLAWWCLLVPWAYLWARAVKRANKTGADWGLLAGAVAAWLLIVIISVPVTGSAATTGAIFNQAQVQTAIANGVEAKSGVAVTVS